MRLRSQLGVLTGAGVLVAAVLASTLPSSSATVAGSGGGAEVALVPSAAAGTADGFADACSAVRVNVGGSAYRDSTGREWSADTGAVGGRDTLAATRPVRGTQDDELYQSLRVGMSGYEVPVPTPGAYRVTLHFHENHHDAAGDRVFSVSAEGVPVLEGLDLVAAVGPATAHTVTEVVTVAGDTLDLAFSAQRDIPTLSAVEAVLVPPDATARPGGEAPARRPVFPLEAEDADGAPTLVDSTGTPFPYVADTAWLAPSRLDQDEICTLLGARATQGFTAVQMSVLAFLHLSGPENAYGDAPFHGGTDLARPREVGRRTSDPTSRDYDYWDHVDWIVDQAARHGLVLTLVPSWYGYAGEDWRGEVDDRNAAVYGTFLGERLGRHANLLWMLGGDNDPVRSDTAQVPAGKDRGDRIAATGAMAEAIRRAERVPHLMTYHAKRPVSSLAFFADEPWHSVASAYSDERAYVHAAASRGRGVPVIVTEAYYDARTRPPVLDHQRLRAQAWWSVLTGAGFAYGHEEVWDLDPSWRTALEDASAYDVTRMRSIVAGLGQVEPARDVLTQDGRSTGLDRAVSGRTDSGTLTYVPSRRTVTVSLDAAGGEQVRVTWVDPATGDERAAGTFRAAGRAELPWPGWSDAVLVMTPIR